MVTQHTHTNTESTQLLRDVCDCMYCLCLPVRVGLCSCAGLHASASPLQHTHASTSVGVYPST